MTPKRTIRHVYNLQYYKPRLWERLILHFADLHAHEQDGAIVTYKFFADRLYIYTVRRITYMCSEPPNGGRNKHWEN